MKKLLAIAVIAAIPFALFVFKEERPPQAVVETLFARITELKDALKQIKEEGSSEAAAEELAKSRDSVQNLFLNPRRAKALVFSLMMLDLENVFFLEERIEGKNAEVTIMYTVTGFGQQATIEESAQKRDQVTFQLKKEKGRWKIANIQ